MLNRRANPSGSASSPSLTKAHGPPSSTPSRFSFDHLLRRIRTKSHDQAPSDARRKMNKLDASKPIARPSPISTADRASRQPLASNPTGVRLCQSPGGRANVTLAIPVTPPSGAKRSHWSTSASLTVDDDACDDHDARSSFTFGPWQDSGVRSVESSSATVICSPDTSRPALEAATLPPFTRDLVPDVRTLCCLAVSSRRLARQYVFQLLRVYHFEIRSTKWAAYFLLLTHQARCRGAMTSADALSVRFAVCAYVRWEAEARHRTKRAQEKLFQHKMTEYRVAMQCICGASVVKYGRKGKPHTTHLTIENGDTFKWTSVKLLSSKTHHKTKKSISLSEIEDVRAGPTTDVLAKALQKGTLRLQDAKCTLSLITSKRTFDIKAKSTAEREWLLRSFRFLVDLAKDHEKQVARQVELSIMKKMETLPVWKHGRKGRPHKTRLFINRFGELSWQGRSGDTIQLERITAIELGHATGVFRRSRHSGLASPRTASRCFSLVTRTRTLDIETVSEQQRDWYVVAFRYLVDKIHEKTAAMKRDKAEKQLRMLQELCLQNPNSGTQLSDGESGNVGISVAPAPHA